MANEFEQTLREMFGESWNRLSQFQSDQVKKLTEKVHHVAREAVREEMAKLRMEVEDLRNRVLVLESERTEGAVEES